MKEWFKKLREWISLASSMVVCIVIITMLSCLAIKEKKAREMRHMKKLYSGYILDIQVEYIASFCGLGWDPYGCWNTQVRKARSVLIADGCSTEYAARSTYATEMEKQILYGF